MPADTESVTTAQIVRTSSGIAEKLRDALARRTDTNDDYWSFASSRKRSAGHGLFQYPAMMVPELQGALLDDLLAVDSTVRSVYDPFVGSGTVLLESVRRGLDFYGCDINPLAVLLSQVKADPPSYEDAVAATELVELSTNRQSSAVRHEFLFIEKWFTESVAVALSELREAIRAVEDLRTRRYLWVGLAETTRLVSNARTSTVKLHAYDAETLRIREPDVARAFRMVMRRNLKNLLELTSVRSAQHDAEPATTLYRRSILDAEPLGFQADVIMTSPPYGDNQTTVTYGQHSYLPLQWIDHADLVGSFDSSLLASTHRIDTLSLGGSLRLASNARESIGEDSPTLRAFIDILPYGTQLEKKVVSFTYDYARSLTAMAGNLRAGGFIFLTLGQRRIAGEELPLVAITSELLTARGFIPVETLKRKLLLSRRRMGTHNRQGELMAGESILVMQKQM
jgi:hypothetical protein